jgi:hypothetical protein
MKKYINQFYLLMVFLIPSISHSQYSPAIEQINRFIVQGKCADAEIYARSYIQRPTMLTALGIISNDCRRNTTEAIGYFRLAAAENESVAIEFLNAMGVSYTNPQPKNSHANESLQIIQSPPPHRLAPAPRPRETNIILVQPQIAAPVIVSPMFNAAACIQDGGGTYCPNHINSQIRPSYPYGR